MTMSHFLIEELKLSYLFLTLCKVWDEDVDVLIMISEIIRGKFSWFQGEKKKLCDDIQLLKYSDNPSVGVKNIDYMFSFIECLSYSFGEYSPTIEDFINNKNIRRRFYPLHTRSNHMFDKYNIDILLEWNDDIKNIQEAKKWIFEDEGKTTLIDVVNLIRRAINGEIYCDCEDSDPDWSSCNISMYNVDTRYFIFYRDSKGTKESGKYLEKCIQYEIEKTNEHTSHVVERICHPINSYGFIWVGTPENEKEYGRLFYKGDWDICEDYWEKNFHESIYTFSTTYNRLV